MKNNEDKRLTNRINLEHEDIMYHPCDNNNAERRSQELKKASMTLEIEMRQYPTTLMLRRWIQAAQEV